MIKVVKRAYNLLRDKTKDLRVDKKRSSKWGQVKSLFLLKNPNCAICGGIEKLNVHHKLPFHLYPELELVESNLVTLCMGKKECHLNMHGDNFKKYCPNIDNYIKMLNNKEKTIEEIFKIAEKEAVFNQGQS